ncbi:GntR family transcriptional regulator [Aliiruegeria haliotis]|uniref:GntR family transcriptional regulator n=1 Tax=Aliiruegeria haliotis TaxID=1280846 RepID=A0A2T0RLM0_9RHOB|nr:FCD domain-containing protein [Aliiruegeria haliotis]PRY22084.1 GntR family transcriptional regulator [Aliiruegeria haliotis]
MNQASRPQSVDTAPATGRASDAIVSQIQQRILSGELAHNSPLPSERDLMEQFSASRTVIREAVAALASRGFLEAKPRYRPIVRKPGYDTALNSVGSIVELMLRQEDGVRSLFQARVFVERGLVRDAATSATREDIAALKDALAANERAIPESDAFFATDVAFHGVLYRIPQNPLFPTLHAAYASWLAPHWCQMLRSPERNQVNFASHQAIYTAILERDPDAAEEALVTHLDTAWNHVRETFGLD